MQKESTRAMLAGQAFAGDADGCGATTLLDEEPRGSGVMLADDASHPDVSAATTNVAATVGPLPSAASRRRIVWPWHVTFDGYLPDT